MEVLFAATGILFRLIGSATIWLFVDKWRSTFPLHMLLALLVVSGLVNLTPWFASPASAVLFVVVLAGLLCAVVYRTAPRWENAAIGYAVAGLGGAWVLAGYFELFSDEHLFQALMAMLVAFTVLWALDRRVHHRVKIDQRIQSFATSPERQERAKLRDATCLEHEEVPEWGWRAVWTWPGASNTVAEIIKNIRLIEAEFGEPENSLTAERVAIPTQPGRYYSNRIEFRCIRNNPLSHPRVWDGEPVNDLSETVQIGVFGDGRPVTFRLWEPGVGGFHLLASGAARSGKSVLMQLLILLYGGHPAVRMVFVDLKGGAAFKPLAPMGSWLVTDLHSALMLLEMLNLECERRGHYVAQKGWDNGVWMPSEQDPILIANFDEIASLTGTGVPREIRLRALYLFSEIARKGPGIGLLLRIATQEPTKEALGTTQFVTQLEWRAGFRVNQPGRVQYSVPGLSGQIDPYNISREMRGTCYVDAGGQSRAMEARMFNVPTWRIRRSVDEYWSEIGGQPREIPRFDSLTLPPGATISEERHHQMLEAYASRTVWTPELVSGASPFDEDPEPTRPEGAPEQVELPPVPGAPLDSGATPQIEDRPSGKDWGALLDAAQKHPKNSREADSLIRDAIVAYLDAFPGGVARKALADVLSRSPSDISNKTKDLASQGLIHSKDNRWYPGPEPEDDPYALEDDEDD